MAQIFDENIARHGAGVDDLSLEIAVRLVETRQDSVIHEQ
jgi:transcription termination factor Rho